VFHVGYAGPTEFVNPGSLGLEPKLVDLLLAQVFSIQPKSAWLPIAAGAFSAEVLAGTNGELRAFVKDSAGAEVKGDAAASFKAIVSAKGGAREEIALAFDAPRACFAGKVKAGVELAPGPLELLVDAKVGAGIGRLESIGLSVEASHGGQLVAVGDYSVELVAKGPKISAFVFDGSGNAPAAGDLDLKLDLGAGAGTKLALTWDAPSLSYMGTAAANVNLALQPIRVSLVASGKQFVGAVTSLSAAAKASGNLKANFDVAGDASAKLGAGTKLGVSANAKLDEAAKLSAAKAASASVKIAAPKVNVTTSKSASAKASGGSAKASAGFSFGAK
jgi:hypothetical protein